MKKTLTRVLSLVLVLTMFLSAAPLAMAADGDIIKAESITATPHGGYTVIAGNNVTINTSATPANADLDLEYSSSNGNVSISGNKFTALYAGSSTITVTDKNSGKSDTITVNIKAKAPTLANVTLDVGQSTNLALSAVGLNETNHTVTYTVGDSTVAQVTGNVIEGLKAGTTTVTATITPVDGVTTSNHFLDSDVTATVTVNEAEEEPTGYTAALSFTEMTVKIDENKALPTITGLEDLTKGTDYTVEWTRSDTGVNFGTDGSVQGASVGTTNVIATITSLKSDIVINGSPLTLNVKVMPAPYLASADVNKNVAVGATIDAPEVQGLTGLTKGTDYTVTWASNKTSVVSVKDGTKFEGVASGEAVLTGTVNVTAEGYQNTYRVTCNVKVSASLELKVVDKIEIEQGDTYTVKAPTLSGTNAASHTITDWKYEKQGTSSRTSISGNVISGRYTGRDLYKVSATVKDSSGNTVDVDPITVPVSVYGDVSDITVILKDSVSSFTFDDKSVYTSLKLGATEKLNTYDTVEELLLAEWRNHISGRESDAASYELEFTSMIGAGGDLSQTTSGLEARSWFSMNGLDHIKYTRDKGTATKSRFTYYVYDMYDMVVMTGSIVIDYKDTAEIEYATDGEAVTFKEEDFEEFWDAYSNSSYNLDYVKFTDLPSTSEGKLYTTKNMTSAVKTTYKFEPNHTGSANYDLDTVTFDPAANADGTVYIPFTAYGTDGKYVSGNVAIIIGGDAEIRYTTDGTPVIFNEDDFEKFWDVYGTNYDLSYVQFTDLPSTSDGVLYTNSSQNTKVQTSNKFKANYTTSSTYKDLDTVTFDPAANADGTIYIPFTAYGTDGNDASGRVAIVIGGDSDLTITKLGFRFGQTSAKLDDVIAKEFEDENNDEELDYVTFTIPSKEVGQLFYDYNLTTDTLLTGELITKTTKLYYEATSSQKSLADVHFFPSECCPETVTLSYTAYGEDGTTYKGTVTLTVITQDSSSKFTDVKGGTGWAADSVDFLRYHGVVNGVTETTFGPSNKITRGDFMLMLYRAFLADEYEDTTITSNFADVTKGTSDYSKELYQAIGVAKKLGIATGDGTNYYPKKNISREEAMTLIYRTLDELNISLTVTSSKDTGDFSDYSKVSTYAKDPIKYLIEHDIVRGDAGKINPKNNITRAEMAVILHRVLTF